MNRSILALVLAGYVGIANAQPITVSCVAITSGASSPTGFILNLGQPLIGSSPMAGGGVELRLGVVACLAEGCYPDCDQSGTLNIDDFICFQTFFAIADPYADCDGDGTLTIDDFICFQTFFAIGC